MIICNFITNLLSSYFASEALSSFFNSKTLTSNLNIVENNSISYAIGYEDGYSL